MHKHFRMIAISENLKAHGYNGYESPDLAHTRIPGIWNKLGSLYNLEALDIRVCRPQPYIGTTTKLNAVRKM